MWATTMDGGRFTLELAIEDASVYPAAKIPADGVRGPWLQSLRTSQTYVKIDMTLTVVK